MSNGINMKKVFELTGKINWGILKIKQKATYLVMSPAYSERCCIIQCILRGEIKEILADILYLNSYWTELKIHLKKMSHCS